MAYEANIQLTASFVLIQVLLDLVSSRIDLLGCPGLNFRPGVPGKTLLSSEINFDTSATNGIVDSSQQILHNYLSRNMGAADWLRNVARLLGRA